MPDLDAALDELRGLASRPPSQTPDVGEVQAGAHRRRNRRWATSASLAVVIALAAVTLSWAMPTDDDSVDVIDEPTGTTELGPTTSTTIERGLLVEPSTDLIDGQVVDVTVPGTDANQGIAICDVDGIGQPEARNWCDINVQTVVDDVVRLTVIRRIQTGHGIVDCAERPGRCVVGVLTASGTSLTSPISFRPGLESLPAPVISLGRATVANGDEFEVTVTGLEPQLGEPTRDDEILISQCIGEVSDAWTTRDVSWDRCDAARAARTLADGDGSVRMTLVASSEVLTYEGWVPCDPCILMVWAWRQPIAVTPLEVVARGEPIRPQVDIVPTGPYAPGQRVRLEGRGFGPGSTPQPGWCAFRTEDPWSELQGDRRYGHSACAYPSESFAAVADLAGEFVLNGYPMPDSAVQGDDCLDPSFRCGLAWHPGEGMPPAFVTLFEMVR